MTGLGLSGRMGKSQIPYQSVRLYECTSFQQSFKNGDYVVDPAMTEAEVNSCKVTLLRRSVS